MRAFLSDYIFSQASKSQERVQSVLAAAQVGKEDMDTIARRIESIQKRAPIVIRPEPYNGIISNAGFDSVQRDTDVRLKELYDDSNLISLLLDTHTEILSSEVKKQMDQLDAYEKYINNYLFMLSDESFYDYCYTETFTDALQQETSSFLDSLLYDRSGVVFDKQSEVLGVDSGHGVLALSGQFIKTYPLTGYELRSNCRGLITSNTGITKATTPMVGEGWRISISSPRPITSSIEENTDKGAQMELEFWLLSPSLCDSLSINPMADLPVQVLSLKVYDDISGAGEEIISDPFNLDSNKILYFSQRIVAKVKIVVNQPVYKRSELMAAASEQEYANVKQAQKVILDLTQRDKKLSFKAFQRLFVKWFLKSEKARANLVRPEDNLNKYHAEELSLSDAVSYQKDQYQLYSQFKLTSGKRNIFRQWIIDKLFQSQPELLDRFTATDPAVNSEGIYPAITVSDPATADTTLDYKYTLGIKSVEIGITADKNRGVFISKPVPMPVQSGQVRIQAEDTNYYLLNSNLDNKFVTTIEYSVTNKSNPLEETDWVPILPANKGQEVVNERLYPQSSGFARFRFRASPVSTLMVYKNGIELDDQSSTLIQAEDSNAIIGVRISPTHFSLNKDDVFTARYLPDGDPTTINFAEYGFGDKSLASAFDDNGSGELFDGTNPKRIVDLSNHPYVDYARLKDAQYSPLLGLLGTYQPITVMLSSGVLAYNYTNYNGLTQNELSENDDKIAFIHSDRHIIFNRDISEPFRVFYQYEPSYLRYRIIYRINYTQRVSPLVDSITIKTKLNASILGLNNKKV